MLEQKSKWAIEYLDLESEETSSLAHNYINDKKNYGTKYLETIQ